MPDDPIAREASQDIGMLTENILRLASNLYDKADRVRNEAPEMYSALCAMGSFLEHELAIPASYIAGRLEEVAAGKECWEDAVAAIKRMYPGRE